MKNTSFAMLVLLLGAPLLSAGPADSVGSDNAVTYEKNVAASEPVSTDLFRAHELNLDLYGAYSKKLETGKSNGREDHGFGGGFALGYFVTRNVGLRADVTAIRSDDNKGLLHAGLDGLFRFPIEAARLAPYGLVGAGGQFGGNGKAYVRTGLGLEARFTQSVGAFTEGSFQWVDRGADRFLVKAGLRFAF